MTIRMYLHLGKDVRICRMHIHICKDIYKDIYCVHKNKKLRKLMIEILLQYTEISASNRT